MNKYIIKNCPAIAKNKNFPSEYNCTATMIYTCKNKTDCLLKQIVEKCKKYIENYNNKVFYDEDDVKILMGKVMLSQSILSELLNIHPVGHWNCANGIECQKREGCLLKRLAKECKETLNTMKNDSSTNAYAGGRCVEAENVLQMLDIQEVE